MPSLRLYAVIFALLTAIMVVLITITTAALAQGGGNCSTMEGIRAALAERWHEAPVFVGLAANGQAITVFANPDGGSWTIVVATPAGPACMVASGSQWVEGAAPPAPGTEG